MESHPPIEPHDERRQRFSSLMREHHRELLVFAGAVTRDRASSQDILQGAFVSAWRRFADYDETKDFSAWMRLLRPVRASSPLASFSFLEIYFWNWSPKSGRSRTDDEPHRVRRGGISRRNCPKPADRSPCHRFS